MNRSFQHFLRVAFAFCAITTLSVAASYAQAVYTAPNFEVINDGSHIMDGVWVSPVGDNNWGNELLNGVMGPNQFVHALTGYNLPSCMQDVRVEYTDTTIDYYYNLDVCTTNVIFHY